MDEIGHGQRLRRIGLRAATAALGMASLLIPWALFRQDTAPADAVAGEVTAAVAAHTPALPAPTPDAGPPPAALREGAPAGVATVRRNRVDWRLVTGVTRRADSLIGVTCEFEVLDADGQVLELERDGAPGGLFFLTVPPAAHRLRAIPRRFELEIAEAELPAGGIEGLEVLLHPARGSLKGRVVDEAGLAVEGIEMSLRGSVVRRVTGPGGWFRFQPLRDGTYSVAVLDAPMSAGVAPVLQAEIRDRRQAEPLLFIVERGATLAGTARDQQTGEPLAGISVVLGRHLAQPDGGAHRTVMTDGDGAFVFPRLVGGSFRITATDPTGAHARLALDVPELGGDEVRAIALEMSATAGSLGGIVSSADEVAVPFATVTALRRDAAGDPAEQLSTRTDSGGRFHFRTVTAGEWEVAVSDAWSESRNWIPALPARVDVLDGGTHQVELRLQRGAYLRGKVVSSSDQDGLYRVRLHLPDGRAVAKDTGPDGTFAFGGLRSDTYLLEALLPGAEAPVYQTRVYVGGDEASRVELPVP